MHTHTGTVKNLQSASVLLFAQPNQQHEQNVGYIKARSSDEPIVGYF